MKPVAKSLALLALLPLAHACSSLGGAPVGEVAELATMGAARPLREPPRPVRGGTRLLVFALDGVGDDDLRRALREGRLPALAAMLGPGGEDGVYAHGYAAPDVLSVLPSATAPGWAAAFTGATGARSGIAGNEWFVRDSMAFWAPVPMSVSGKAHATEQYTDELMSRLLQAPTVYEGLGVRAHVSMQPFFRGADYLTMPNIATFGSLFEETVKAATGGSSDGTPDTYRETDRASIRSVRRAAEEFGLPDVQVVYFPGTDLTTHQVERPLERQQQYLSEVTGPLMEEVLALYREQGALDSTFVLVVSDHGHTPVLSDDRHSLHVGGDDEPPAVLRQAGFRVRPHELQTEADDYQAVLAYHGFMAFVYLADRGSCPQPGTRCDWSAPPRLAEDVLPVARAFHEASRTGAGVPALRGALDLVLVRDRSGAGWSVYQGDGLVSLGEYLRRTPRPDLLRLQPRLEALVDGPHGDRAGDLLLLARTGTDLPLEERFYFAPPSWSEHGGAHAQDSRIPLLLIHPARSGPELRALVRGALGEVPSLLDVAEVMRRAVSEGR